MAWDGISKRRRLGLVMLFNDRSPILHVVLQSYSLIMGGIEFGALQ